MCGGRSPRLPPDQSAGKGLAAASSSRGYHADDVNSNVSSNVIAFGGSPTRLLEVDRSLRRRIDRVFARGARRQHVVLRRRLDQVHVPLLPVLLREWQPDATSAPASSPAHPPAQLTCSAPGAGSARPPSSPAAPPRRSPAPGAAPGPAAAGLIRRACPGGSSPRRRSGRRWTARGRSNAFPRRSCGTAPAPPRRAAQVRGGHVRDRRMELFQQARFVQRVCRGCGR